MDFTCWMVPIKPGMSDEARAYCQEMATVRRLEFETSEREIGIEREVFFFASVKGQDYIILYMQGPDMQKSINAWEATNGPFEKWGKERWERFSEPKDWPRPVAPGKWEPAALEMLCAYDKDLVT